MAKATWNEYDSTPGNNTVVDDVNIDEACPPSGINNAIRELMAHTADVVAGTTAINRLIVDNIDINGTTIGHTSDTDLMTLTSGNLAVAGDVTTTGAIELGHASDTTLARASAGELTVEGNAIYRAGGTDVPVADGGTGRSTLTANYALLGDGTSAVQMIAPGADGQVMTSTGSTWVSEAVASGGPSQATQGALEAETNEDTYAPPDLIKHNPGVCKAWVSFEMIGTQTIFASHNITSIADGGTGRTDVTIATDFSSVNYCVAGGVGKGSDTDERTLQAPAGGVPTAGVIKISVRAGTGLNDAQYVHLAMFGDQ